MKDSKKYFKDIKKLFPVNGKREKMFLNDFKAQIDTYEQENNSATYNDYVEDLGSPVDIVISYYQTIDSPYILKRMEFRRIISCIALLVVVMTLTVSIYYVYTMNKAYEKWESSVPNEYTETIEEIK